MMAFFVPVAIFNRVYTLPLEQKNLQEIPTSHPKKERSECKFQTARWWRIFLLASCLKIAFAT